MQDGCVQIKKYRARLRVYRGMVTLKPRSAYTIEYHTNTIALITQEPYARGWIADRIVCPVQIAFSVKGEVMAKRGPIERFLGALKCLIEAQCLGTVGSLLIQCNCGATF